MDVFIVIVGVIAIVVVGVVVVVVCLFACCLFALSKNYLLLLSLRCFVVIEHLFYSAF